MSGEATNWRQTGGVNWRTPSTSIIIIIIRQASTCLTPPTPLFCTPGNCSCSAVYTPKVCGHVSIASKHSVSALLQQLLQTEHILSRLFCSTFMELFEFYWACVYPLLAVFSASPCGTFYLLRFLVVLSCRDLTLMSQIISYWFFFLVISAAVVQKSVSAGFMGNVLGSGCLYIRVNISWFIQ